MANDERVAQLRNGVAAWNQWREISSEFYLDFFQADLRGANLRGANLSWVNLREANLGWANLRGANLERANLQGANLNVADLSRVRLEGADLSEANLRGAKLHRANLRGANLRDADLGLNPTVAKQNRPFKARADLDGADLSEANLRGTKLSGAQLRNSDLMMANLCGADLSGAQLRNANLKMATLRGADLSAAELFEADLGGADLREANLENADLRGVSLLEANLSDANLHRANLQGANLRLARATGANLSGADLQASTLVEADLRDANLTDCRVYGVSAWRPKLAGAKQQNLIITQWDEATVTVDNIEVAQFIYLLLHNEKIRNVIDTIGKKGVLLLGRFTEARIEILERLRDRLRSLGYVPMVFNFDKPETKDFTETVRLLANLSHFVIVDITNPRSAPLELQAAVPDYMVPFAPILEQGQDPFAMFVDLQNKYDWVLKPVIGYPSVDRLLQVLENKIIRPAEAKFNELLARRTAQLRVENV
jgi:uncharacterized protein YjbI with pentapeptide repeats